MVSRTHFSFLILFLVYTDFCRKRDRRNEEARTEHYMT